MIALYPYLLAAHSLVRWMVLLSLFFALFWTYRGYLLKKEFSVFSNWVRLLTTAIAHVQLLLGVFLYLLSPVIDYFLQHTSEAVHLREIRFFGMEHSTMMLLAIIFMTVGAVKTTRKPLARQKYKTMAIWFSLALLLILSSIPWSFSPLVSRPNFRPF